MNTLTLLPLFSVTLAILALLIQQSHFLISLLCLEGIILNIVLLVPIIIYEVSVSIPSISIVILTFGACEARLGLRLIVKISRSSGSDIVTSTIK